MDVETYSTINNAFDVLESTIATAMEDKHVEPEGYQVISSALSQLRQTIITLFSRLIDANKSLEKDLRQMKTTLTNVEADSSAMKKSNFIADLMAPLLDKIMDKMQEKSIEWYWYSSRELTRLKISINRDPNWINSHPLARGGSRKLVRGWRLRSKDGFQIVFKALELLFFRFYREKIEKQIYEGVALARSPTAGSATATCCYY